MKIGFVIWLGENEELTRSYQYSELRDLALQAEQSGFDSIWLYDHLLFREEDHPTGGLEGVWECWTMLSALAEATQRVELGTLVLCNQFRNPALLAKMAITLDEVSDGRFILGIGAGWHQPEFTAFGIPFDHRVDRLEEALQIIGPLLKEGIVDFEGTYYQARECEILPRGPRSEGPPVMIGGRDPRMLRLTAQYADIWNLVGCHKPELLIEPVADLRAACAEVGRDPATLPVTAHVEVAYPRLGKLPWWMNADDFLTGSVDEIAAALEQFDRLGASHLMFHTGPFTAPALSELAEAVDLYRRN